MTIQRMRIATNMLSEYVILIALPLRQKLHERASILLCTYIVLCCVVLCCVVLCCVVLCCVVLCCTLPKRRLTISGYFRQHLMICCR
jgi:hypothetical protein